MTVIIHDLYSFSHEYPPLYSSLFHDDQDNLPTNNPCVSIRTVQVFAIVKDGNPPSDMTKLGYNLASSDVSNFIIPLKHF